MNEAQSILSDIQAFLSERGIAEKTFGFRAANNTRLLERLRSGTASLATVAKVRKYIEQERAKEAEQ